MKENAEFKTLRASSYKIFTGTETLSELENILSMPLFAQSRIFVLVDENTKKYCYPLIKKYIKAETTILEIKSGEKHKTLATAEKLWLELMKKEAHRNSVMINLGGGVITDLGGFVASAYKRGISFINIPTTLLAQVDASYGGKTGIDFNGIKNQIGFFSNPEAVIVNPAFLSTLPKRELLSGFAEVIKHALISDALYWRKLKEETAENMKEATDIIYRSVHIKNRISKADPLEKSIRKKLNYGHTIGHAIESLSLTKDKKPLLHGEAVAVGMICESYLSYLKAGLSKAQLKEITDYIFSIYPHVKIKAEDIKQLLSLMEFDKKNNSKEINFTLLKKIGESEINFICTKDEIKESLNYYNNGL